MHHSRKKAEQIRAVNPDMIVLPCHSCHGQIKQTIAHYELPEIPVKYLWELVADALIINC
jgi:Fe-S oxidoreductase